MGAWNKGGQRHRTICSSEIGLEPSMISPLAGACRHFCSVAHCTSFPEKRDMLATLSPISFLASDVKFIRDVSYCPKERGISPHFSPRWETFQMLSSSCNQIYAFMSLSEFVSFPFYISALFFGIPLFYIRRKLLRCTHLGNQVNAKTSQVWL